MSQKKTFICIDAHTCGNPVRLVKEGGPKLQGNSMNEKRQHFLLEFDWIRKGLMFEPRGHDMMSGSILYPPHDAQNDIAVLFIETSGCLAMCGHGTIGTITIGIEEGLIRPKVPGYVRMETPAGLIIAEYSTDRTSTWLGEGGGTPLKEQDPLRVTSVRFTNIPSFLEAEDLKLDCPELGELTIDVAYGGNFYAIIDVQRNFRGLEHYTAEKLISWGRELRKSINTQYEF